MSILILKTYEDQLLDMNFEMMLAQIRSLPIKFLLGQCMTIQDKYTAGLKDLEKQNELQEEERLLRQK